MKPELALKPHNGPILNEKNSPERTLAQEKKKMTQEMCQCLRFQNVLQALSSCQSFVVLSFDALNMLCACRGHT